MNIEHLFLFPSLSSSCGLLVVTRVENILKNYKHTEGKVPEPFNCGRRKKEKGEECKATAKKNTTWIKIQSIPHRESKVWEEKAHELGSFEYPEQL